MPKEKKPGWDYFYSEALKQEFAIHKDSGWVYFSDGVKYSPEEIEVLQQEGGKIDSSVHNAKKIFQGEIVKNENGNTNSGKVDGVNSDTGGKTPETRGISPAAEYGELEIY